MLYWWSLWHHTVEPLLPGVRRLFVLSMLLPLRELLTFMSMEVNCLMTSPLNQSQTMYLSLQDPIRIQVTPDGKGPGASVIDVTVSLSGGTYYTAAALGTQSSGFSLKTFVDNNWIRDEKAKVRVYHLSPDAGPVNVAVGGTTVINDLTYKHASGYLTVAPGSYTFNVTAVDYRVTIPIKAQLKEGNVYSVFAVGLVKGSPSIQFVISAFNSDED